MIIVEHITRRLVAALRFVDAATAAPIITPLTLQAPGMQWFRKPGGDYIVLRAAGNFLEYTVSDPTSYYLPRRQRIALPRDPNPDNAEQSDSIFQPAVLALYPSPTARPAPGAAALRTTVVNQNQQPLPGALVRVERASDNTLLGRGLTAWQGRTRGEALVVVAGLPITTWGDENDDDAPVLIREIAVTAQAIVDPAFDPAGGQLPDPDDLEARRNTLPTATVAIQLAAHQETVIRIEIPIPA